MLEAAIVLELARGKFVEAAVIAGLLVFNAGLSDAAHDGPQLGLLNFQRWIANQDPFRIQAANLIRRHLQ